MMLVACMWRHLLVVYTVSPTNCVVMKCLQEMASNTVTIRSQRFATKSTRRRRATKTAAIIQTAPKNDPQVIPAVLPASVEESWLSGAIVDGCWAGQASPTSPPNESKIDWLKVAILSDHQKWILEREREGDEETRGEIYAKKRKLWQDPESLIKRMKRIEALKAAVYC